MSEQGGDTRIELMFRLEAALKRIEQLEAALQAIIIRCEEGDKNFNWLPTISNIARAALDQSSPPKENAAGWHIEPKRQENDDVFPGFRGNNDSA
jgi:hypothetical protein